MKTGYDILGYIENQKIGFQWTGKEATIVYLGKKQIDSILEVVPMLKTDVEKLYTESSLLGLKLVIVDMEDYLAIH